MQPIDVVLGRLDHPRERARGQWSARCPAHEDRGPSLSVRETDDGRVLLHCFAGCGVDSVVGALGLDVQDLYPPRDVPGGGRPAEKRRRLLTAGQALELLETEITLALVASSDMARGQALDEATRERLLLGAARVAMLRDEVRA